MWREDLYGLDKVKCYSKDMEQGNQTTKQGLDEQNRAPLKDKEEGEILNHVGGIELTKLTETDKKEQERTTINKRLVVENWIKLRGVVDAICEKVGISRETFYQWRRNDAEFRKKLEDIDKDAGDIGEDILRQLAFLKKDPGSLRFWLRANNPKYKLKVQTEIVSTGVTPQELVAEFIKKNRDGNKSTTTTDDQGGTIGVHGVDISDKGQTPEVSSIQGEQSAKILLEKKDEKKSSSESETKGVVKDNRRRPAPRLYSERH